MGFGATKLIQACKMIYFIRTVYFQTLYYQVRTCARAVNTRIFHTLRAQQILTKLAKLSSAQCVEYSSVHSAHISARLVI